MTARATFRSGLRISRLAAVVCVALAAGSVADGSGGGALPMATVVFSNEAEALLVRTIVGLREQGMKTAMAEVDRMVERNPNYKLAHVLQGDLLMARAGKPVAFAAKLASVETMAPIQDEARVRMQRYLDAPPVNYLPAALLQLGPRQAHALVIDTSRSRLFVYANDLGRPRYVTDFYISLGKYGVEKEREGDMKTPIGVYTVTADKERVPDLYGPRAFPLSYPNDWDRVQGRRGHGIWLHGTPSGTYSRPPWATDGCVVLTNDDLAKLTRYVDVSHTPVVISPSIQWRDRRAWEAEREAFLAAFGRWKKDWESRDADRYFAHYSSRFRSEKRDFAAWKAHKRQVNAEKSWVKVGIDDVSLFAYPGVKDMMMVTFRQDYRSSNLSNRTMKRQYWVREGGEWRILLESVVS